MTESSLTVDEKRCLQMWFRQAIVKAEADRVVSELLEMTPAYADKVLQNRGESHLAPIGRRTKRFRTVHQKVEAVQV